MGDGEKRLRQWFDSADPTEPPGVAGPTPGLDSDSDSQSGERISFASLRGDDPIPETWIPIRLR
ncbi:hypothetical protein SAMN05216285_0689 [Natrinema salifodinae]|uniref:Uncharacterized protein n=1 Tax=Natrinema salifodinae TaxID=1202768 RepID=A0A1I0MAL4_9EURY|nr:hypothetical protein SAMN05216285_0689 [Natrinema salifodinae]